MKHLIKSTAIERISPGDGHYFFGYYDLQPYDADEKLHLAHKTSFRNRLQTKDDLAQIGVIDMKSKKYDVLDTTNAWNFQQGAMLQWNPKRADREAKRLYNKFTENEKTNRSEKK